jgi:glycosyltransferase involved in cell wall biosynthesis
MRIGFYTRAIFTNKGGIERLAINLSHAMLQRGHECVIFHHGCGDGVPVFPLREEVRTCDLALNDSVSLKRAKHLVRQADLDVLCVMTSGDARLWFLNICNNSGIPLLMSEHSSPQHIERFYLVREERLASLAAADGIHLLSRGFLSSLPGFLQDRATAIPNPAPPPVPVNWDKENAPRKRLLAVGRLADLEKQFSILIQAFALLAQEFPDWDCHICGNGEHYEEYAALIRELHLDSRVFLAGAVDDVDAYYASSHLFCIPSAFEGFGFCLVEAQSHGLPAVGFAGCTGVNEIIVHGENGLLAQRMVPSSLAASLRTLMESATLRRGMGERAQEMLSRYDETSIFDQWERMLHKTAAARDHTRLNFPPASEEERAEWNLQELVSQDNLLENAEQILKKHKEYYTAALLRANLDFTDALVSSRPLNGKNIAKEPYAHRFLCRDFIYRARRH